MPKLTIYLFLLSLFFSCSNDTTTSTATEVTVSDSSQTTNSTVVEPPAKKVLDSPFQEGAFENVDVTAFNQKLAKSAKSLSPAEVIKLYYPAKIAADDHSFQHIKIEEKVEGDKKIVTLTHDNQPHMTIQGHRMMMTMVKEGKHWKVEELKQQFKCWKRTKGDVVWSTNKCPLK